MSPSLSSLFRSAVSSSAKYSEGVTLLRIAATITYFLSSHIDPIQPNPRINHFSRNKRDYSSNNADKAFISSIEIASLAIIVAAISLDSGKSSACDCINSTMQ